MSYRQEFPNFDPATMPEIPTDWEDVSWHNDACPTFAPSLGWRVWVNYVEQKDRELGYPTRFAITRERSDGDIDQLFDSDEWNAVVAFVKREVEA
jgi:hypothetical protein